MQKKYYLPFFLIVSLAAICLTTAQAIAATPQIATGYYHNVVLDADGNVWTWGSNLSGQLCDTTRPSPDAQPRPIPGLINVVYIAAGSDYTLAVKSDGTVWTCGANNYGQLGRGFTSDYERDIGMVVDPDDPYGTGSPYLNLDVGGTVGTIAVAAGNNHSLAIRNDGTVWGWGINYGKLGVDEPARELCGDNQETFCSKPVQAADVTNAVAISAGLYHSMALDTGGAVWTWGSNNGRGQLGRSGDPGYEYVPATVADINDVTITGIAAIAAGWEHSLAVTSGGNLYGWGTNKEYQVLVSNSYPDMILKYNTTQQTPALILSPPPSPNFFDDWGFPSPPSLLTDIVAVSASQGHSMIVKSSAGVDSVIGWGKNGTDSYVYTQDGATQTRVLADFRGALGLGYAVDRAFSPLTDGLAYRTNYPPAAPLWGSNILSIETGRQHSLALRADGTVYVSGVNAQYQLGNSTSEFISTPAAVRMTAMTCDTSGTDFNFNVNNPPDDCDFDGDGEPYATDNCPSLANDQADIDSNGIGDACDDPCTIAGGDTDGDEICDDFDNCSNIANSDQGDSDNDGMGNTCDACPNDPDNDSDGDGVCGDVDNCPNDINSNQADNDTDTMGDACDTDDDNDTILDDFPDNCPFAANTDQADNDTDGLGDVCDTDDDNDTILDINDNCPVSFGLSSDQTDTDSDGLGDVCDPDDDGDGALDGSDNCPVSFGISSDQTDTDSDGLGDVCDPDDDADGVLDGSDNCPVSFGLNSDQTDTDSDGLGDVCDPDDDGDGVLDASDNCQFIANADQANNDNDLLGNSCDSCPEDANNDADADGICGEVDNCPNTPNTAQLDSDSDGLGNACDSCVLDAFNDADNDGVCGDIDNCPDIANSNQTDSDSDGLGDVCDTCPVDKFNDLDNDGICGDIDNCPNDSNNDQTDNDNDSIGDACDTCPDDAANDADNDGFCSGTGFVSPKIGDADNCPDIASSNQTDTDSDGLGDVCDPDDDGDGVLDASPDNCQFIANADQTDTDSDGLGDVCDPDDDADGVLDASPDNCQFIANADQTDTDSDGLGDVCDPDDDGDGVFDASDNCPVSLDLGSDQTDTDSDGLGDVCDPDDDGDGVLDGNDNCPSSFGLGADQTDTDIDGFGDVCDPDDDGDGILDDLDNCPIIANTDQANNDDDSSGNACDSCPGDRFDDIDNDGICAGIGYDATSKDGDSDNCPDTSNSNQTNSDSDGFGDACDVCPGDADNDADKDGICAGIGYDAASKDGDSDNCPGFANADQADLDGDLLGDVCDDDKDNDGVANILDSHPTDPTFCSDTDEDGCEDCAVQIDGFGPESDFNRLNDGPDYDGDGICDAGDLDDDNDGVADGLDTDSSTPNVCADADNDGCDDCAVTGADGSGGSTTNDGPDYDGNGLCDAFETDDDKDGVPDTSDSNPHNEFVCADADNDSCDDCAVTGADGSGGSTTNDGPDYDGNGLCDAFETDDDKDGVPDTGDSDPLNEFVCADVDNDSCDDCAVSGADGSGGSTTNDGPDYDGNGLCDAGETDDDKDGVSDTSDSEPLNEFVCADADSDLCDDCAVTGADDSGGSTTNDGLDTDGDGLCDTGDTDNDNDGVDDATDTNPLNALICADADSDSCDDCSVTGGDGSGGSTTNDGLDSDGDGLCDTGDTDNDNDGVGNATDTNPLNALICADADSDSCDDCAVTGADGSGGDISNDGSDIDGDGICDAGDFYADKPNLVDPGISAIEIPPTSNIDVATTNPKVNEEFPFEVTVDANEAASVWLVLDDQLIEMDCGSNPDFSDPSSEIQCTSSVKLGPAPVPSSYHYEVLDSDDKVLVSSLEIEGPTVHLLNGPNMLGLPKDASKSSAGLLNIMGSTSVFSWQSAGLRDEYNKGSFVAHDNTNAQIPGKGYFVIGESENQTLPASLLTDPDINDITDPTVTINLQPGWNLISNPYPVPILLENLMVQQNSASAISWADASASNWVFNGIYYFKGSDWGSQYAFESAGGITNATLTPWLAFWIYLKVDDGATYKLIFSKP